MAGAPQSQKGIRLYSNKPKGVVNAVFGLSSSSTATWLKPLARSRVVNHDARLRLSSDSSIRAAETNLKDSWHLTCGS